MNDAVHRNVSCSSGPNGSPTTGPPAAISSSASLVCIDGGQLAHPRLRLIPDVPDQPERPARPQHARDLGRRARRVDPVPRLPEHHGIHRRIGQRQLLARADEGPDAGEPLREPRQHLRVGIDRRDRAPLGRRARMSACRSPPPRRPRPARRRAASTPPPPADTRAGRGRRRRPASRTRSPVPVTQSSALMLTSHMTPNASTTMPKVAPHGAVSSSCVTVPPMVSFFQ